LDDEVDQLVAAGNTFMDGLDYDYYGGEDAHYSVDHLGANNNEMLFTCELDVGRMVVVDSTKYKTVTASSALGAMANGDTLNVKAYLVSEIVDFFLNLFVVSDEENMLPGLFAGVQNYPNPFTTETRLDFVLQSPENIVAEIYNSQGMLIRELTDQKFPAGNHSLFWDGTNANGEAVTSGYYFYRIKNSNQILSGKMILVK